MQPDQTRKRTRKWAIPIILVTILGAVGSYAVSKRLAPTYAATSRALVVAPGSSSSGPPNGNSTQATITAASLITQPALLGQVISTLDLRTSVDNLAKEVAAVAQTNSEMVDVTVSDPSPAVAAQVANALVATYVMQVSRVNAARITQASLNTQIQIDKVAGQLVTAEQQLVLDRTTGHDPTVAQDAVSEAAQQLNTLDAILSTFVAAQAATLDSVSVAETASTPITPASPNVPVITAIGGLLALVLAAAAACLLEFRDRRLRRAR